MAAGFLFCMVTSVHSYLKTQKNNGKNVNLIVK